MKRFRKSWMAGMIVGFVLPIAAMNGHSQAWVVPDDQKGELATFKFTDEVVRKGAQIFAKNCQSCHGIPGKANWAKLTPVPGDPASPKFAKDTDGELFYKISNGRGPMPQFKSILGEEDRWNVIAYLRTFHKGYVQPNPELAKAAAKGGRAAITMTYDTSTRKMIFMVVHTKDKLTTAAAHAGILVFVQRYFGILQIGEVKTNDKGYAAFEFPKDIPGDSAGKLAVLARLNESSGYGYAEKTDSIPAGKAVQWVSLTEPRAMWNIRSKAPVWLMLSYSLTVIGVFVILFYILMQIRKIHHAGREISRANEEPYRP